jgi:hypothetical protein
MKPASTQMDKGLEFDGIGSGPAKGSTKYAHNKWSGHSNDGRLVQKAQSPNRRGNDGSCHNPGNLGASVTKDTDRKPMTSPLPSLPAQGSIRDNINRGQQYRGVGGTVVKKPSTPDKIRDGQSGGPGFGSTSKGTRPVGTPRQDGINYGPKKQY